jgi:hypothetical protein
MRGYCLVLSGIGGRLGLKKRDKKEVRVRVRVTKALLSEGLL